MAREFTKVGVVGLGTIGAGIAEVLARTGVGVVGVEVSGAALEHGRGHLSQSTGRAVERGKMSAEEQQALLDRITFTTDPSQLADCQLVVEAVPERSELKRGVFGELDRVCGPETVLATSTSSLSVIELAIATSRPGKVLGMQWFTPAPVTGLVEVVPTVVTEPAVLEEVEALVARVDKQAVRAADKTGFIVGALLLPYLNQAVGMYEAHYATREDIDAAMRFGCGYPMGPLAVLDLIGLDTAYQVLDTMYHRTRDHRHAPAPILKQLVTAGMLGRKTGRGFYTYAEPHSPRTEPDVLTPQRGAASEGARPVQRIGVVGTGTMATGIVEVCAKAGYDVVFRARSDEKAAGVRSRVEKSMDKAVQRGKLPEGDRDAALARITGTVRLDDLADCDLVIEGVVEELSVKQGLFDTLDGIMKPGAVLTTTTSSLPVIQCAASTSRPADVIGMHFFNPATVMKLVEVVPTVLTAPDVVATVRAVCDRLGKVAVLCGDRAGFIVNALLFPYLNDAVMMLDAQYAPREDIDTAMKLACGYPMGPFELLDVVGLDVSLAIQRTLYHEFREPTFAPAPLLEHLVTAGYLGRKTGKGFLDY
ncbi:MAG: 3-hydroxyacyl-CoA dehydrogenase family protein, partial [Mycobacterium leprae]